MIPASLVKIKSELQQFSLVLGGLLIILLIYSILSGMLLSMFYSPAPESAYESVELINNSPVVSFFRNFHFWAADILVFVLFLHMTRVALTKPSGRPRRYAWWLGVGLLIMIGAEMLIGTFLRADQESQEAYAHFFIGTSNIVAGYLPFVTLLTNFFSEHAALFRFFVFHSVVLPFGILSLIVLHGLFAPSFRTMLMPWKKITDAAIRGSLKPEGFFSHPSVRKILALCLISFFLITVLSLTIPAPLLSPPYSGVEVTKPPWWLLWVVAGENIWGLPAIVIMPPLLFFIFLLIPLFSKDKPGADLGVYIYLVTIAVLISISFWASRAPQVAHTEHYLENDDAVPHGESAH